MVNRADGSRNSELPALMAHEDTADPTAPNAGNQQRDPRQDAGQDRSIAERLAAHPEDVDTRLDNALDESMDASDPPEITQPGAASDPAPSSGYNDEEGRDRSA